MGLEISLVSLEPIPRQPLNKRIQILAVFWKIMTGRFSKVMYSKLGFNCFGNSLVMSQSTDAAVFRKKV